MNTIVQKVCLCVECETTLCSKTTMQTVGEHLAGNDVSAELERVETAKHLCISGSNDRHDKNVAAGVATPARQADSIEFPFCQVCKASTLKTEIKIGLQASLQANS